MTSQIITVTLFIFFNVAAHVNADFNFFVRIHSYDNPTNKCPNCRFVPEDSLGCCDSFSIVGECLPIDNCDNTFFYCLRDLGSPRNTNPNIIQTCSPTSYISSINDSGEDIDFTRSTVLGLPNPLPYRDMPGAWEGLQVYTRVFDDDSGASEDEFVDSFSIDVEQIPVGEETRPQVFNGTFGFAFIEMSFKVECSSGYTGDLCEVVINDCLGVDCSGNGECSDGVNTFECNCFPGYTGLTCEVEIANTATMMFDAVSSTSCLAVGLGTGGAAVLVVLVLLVVFLTAVIIDNHYRNNTPKRSNMEPKELAHNTMQFQQTRSHC